MKKYTHAWLAFMAIKRLDTANIPEEWKPYAQSLVKWFHNYRDFVIEGSWYPDEVFKDMSSSHIAKHHPKEGSSVNAFKVLPSTMQLYQLGLKSDLYGKEYEFVSGNLADRCESLAHGIVDCFKMVHLEDKGCPISPTNNHIAMRFFILSHYVADCHMPLHCDCRSFSSGDNIHGLIETQWDNQVKKSYKVDTANQRFFYDPQGYPLATKTTNLIQQVEDDLKNREFRYDWGSTKNKSTWDYMSAISQYSYLMAYRMIPSKYDESLTKEQYKASEEWARLDEDSLVILSDAIDSIARIWLHVWVRYQDWAKKR